MASLIKSLSLALGAVSAAKIRTRDTMSFPLYAYGTGIGGEPVFYKDDLAFLGGSGGSFDALVDSDDNVSYATFTTPNPSVGTTWTANPNRTADWSDMAFYAPASGSSGSQMGFIPSGDADDSDDTTSGWQMMDIAVLVDDDGSYQSLFQAVPTSDANVWELHWDSDDSSAIQVVLRTRSPSNPSSK